ncbi:feruloyl-CoA synthase [Pseudonocardia asaccharolytica]|uniref:Feruloyl-CoA synthase n=1 Tax=Pseudonocardia asaccharolytica DSM 44247 = NBRC 16224 TaxID=1123024 RepID=A0A511CXT1_9PSEU|nr:feruloyl-CoA synthase [Pseudonocardia asaccharolytica]GEL17277.1 feruloyl-CoA synthase [Pseudonocardia asaccharolytica DSM 44247 = NBRC 16224]
MTTAPPACRPTFALPHIQSQACPDGRLLLRSAEPLGPRATSVIHEFRAHSEAHPERLLVAERDADGQWARSTWGEVRAQADRLAQGMLDRGLTDRPVMVLSGNSRLHLVVTLAAMTVGVPLVPASVAYSLQSTDHAKLRAMVELTDPGLMVAEDPAFAPAVAAGRPVLSQGGIPGSMTLDELSAEPRAEVDLRCARLRPEDVAKILFTSGSTGVPKGVLNTHGMLAANQQQMRQVWPFLLDEPPVLLDWLPWSHTFGGNHNLNMVLTGGGTLWIDDGRPAPALIERTVRNLADARPTTYFNVPAGHAALLPHLERDPAAARAFFERLRLGFFAAAALPQQMWDRLSRLAAEHHSSMRMTTSWGLTESSPAATSAHFPITRSDCLGVPLPGIEVALVPVGEKLEVRLRGPNITPGYHRRPDLAETAFDEHGYLRTGDAVALADPDDPAAGLVFRGRIAEDFKLATGTFVSVGTLRPQLLSASAGLLTDAVICGENGDRVTALVWLHPDHAHRCDADGVPDAGLRADLAATMARLAAEGSGSSQRIDRLAVLLEPPALDTGESTDKGYVNQRAVRERRADKVALLSAEPCPPQVVPLA